MSRKGITRRIKRERNGREGRDGFQWNGRKKPQEKKIIRS